MVYILEDESEARTLVASNNTGRYACNDPAYGVEPTSGMPIAILLGGHWVEGRVEHSGLPTDKYPEADGCYAITGTPGMKIGYYFISQQGDVCGLCVGMKVRLYRG